MTINEAIKHAEEVAKKQENNAKNYPRPDKSVKGSGRKYNAYFKCAEEHRQLAEWLKELKLLREQTRWIPVIEKLPEDHKYVLICLSSDEICIGSYNSHRLPFSNHAIGWGASYVHNWCSDDVIAWMPLPEPYKASSTGTESEVQDAGCD